ncbi:muscle M-line assembly protein unc-89 isoform X6 [Triticum aestivum]|uniref:muscle M-line assembly protein unc-89 isoform X6 n=1 Tax=Triticum aestivum TaxID=4565 RepID=UPI001D02F729|nr:muscle M-line assembly protein unc-89-like isoform X6 [Triticum aestivum]
MANGLTGVDFARCWISWSIMPLSRRPGLMCEYTGSLKDPQRHIDIQLTDDEVTEAVKKMLNEPEVICSQTGLSPFCTSNKPPAGEDPFWKKKPQDKPAKPQDKPAKPLRPKTKVVKKPAKKRTTASSEPNADADVANPDLEDDAESSQADDVETQQHEARRTTRHSGQVVTSAGLPNTSVRKRRSEVSYTLDTSCPKAGCFRQPLNPSDSNYQGTSHSSSGKSSATKLPPLKTVPGAKPRPSKKARLTKPADDNVVVEPEKTPDPEETNADAILNDPPPQDHDFFAEQVEVDTTSHADKATSPVRTDDKPVSPAKDTNKLPTPVKAADDKEDDVMITSFGHTAPGNPVALSKHSAKDELSTMGKGKWSTDLSSYAHLNSQDIHSGFLNRLYTSRDFEAVLVNLMKERYEAELSKKEAQTADQQENIKSQQAETSKAKDELSGALAAMEKLKESFNKERADWDTEKSALQKRVEDAEAALKPVVDELTGVKRQIHAMTAVVFGKHPCFTLLTYHPIRYRFTDACNDAGTCISHLGSDVQKKLKAAYTLIEQLYTGAQRIICTASHNKSPPMLIKDTLERLSMLPARVEELKRSAARAGALTALTRAKAWVPDLDPEDVSKGYPSLKEDGSEFGNEELRAINQEVRPLACQLAEEGDLSHYQASYDIHNKRVAAPTPEVQNLIPPIRKHTYAPDIELSTLISDEAVFQALTGIDWTTIDFQPLGRDEEDEPAQDDPQPSGQDGDEA